MKSISWALILLTIVNLMNFIDRYVIAAVAPLIQSDLGLSNFQLGTLMSAFMIGYMLTSPLFGMWGDRWNRPRLMALGAIVWSLATIASGLAQGFLVLLLTRIFVGIGEASYGTISPAYIRDMSRDEKDANRQFAVFYIAIPVGAALGYILGGAISARFGWQMAFFATGAPGILLGLLTWRLRENRPQNAIDKINADAKDPQSLKKLFDDLQMVWSLPLYRLVVIGYTLYTFALGGFAAWAPQYGVRALGADLESITFGFGIVTLIAAAGGTLLGGRIGEWFVARGLEVEGFSLFSGIVTLASIPFATLAFFTDDLQLFLAYMFAAEFLMFAATAPVATATLASAPKHLAATAMALQIFVIHAFGDLISPPLIGWLSDQMAMSRAMLILPVAGTLGALVWCYASSYGFNRNERSRVNYPMSPLVLGIARFFQWLFRRMIKVFLRELTVLYSDGQKNAESARKPRLQDDVPTLFISNHPNALMDVFIIYATSRQALRSVGMSTLWNIGILRPLLALAGTVPVFRKSDQTAPLHSKLKSADSNESSITEVAHALTRDSFVIYPEGMSHDGPALLEFRTGAARMLLTAAKYASRPEFMATPMAIAESQMAMQMQDKKDLPERLGFQPVGIYYDRRTRFRSRAVIHYGQRIPLKDIFNPQQLAEIKGSGAQNDLVKQLTERMQTELAQLIPEATDEQAQERMHQLAQLMLDAHSTGKLADRYRWEVLLKHVFVDLDKIPNQLRMTAQKRIEDYFGELTQLGVEDVVVRDYSADKLYFYQRMIRRNLAYWGSAALLSPVILAGYMMYFWIAKIIALIVQHLKPHTTELATYKFFGGVIFFGLFSLIYGSFLFGPLTDFVPWPWALLCALTLPPLSGLVTLRFHEQLEEKCGELRILFSKGLHRRIQALGENRKQVVDHLLELYQKYLLGSPDRG